MEKFKLFYGLFFTIAGITLAQINLVLSCAVLLLTGIHMGLKIHHYIKHKNIYTKQSHNTNQHQPT